MRYRPPVLERFWSRVSMVGNVCECWLWTGGKSGSGYGSFRPGSDRRKTQAHRFSYLINVNPDIGDLVVDHICRVPICVNPWHLEAVTTAENLRRSMRGVDHMTTATFCPRGHEYTAENTYNRPGFKWRDCRTCRAESTRKYRMRRTENAS